MVYNIHFLRMIENFKVFCILTILQFAQRRHWTTPPWRPLYPQQVVLPTVPSAHAKNVTMFYDQINREQIRNFHVSEEYNFCQTSKSIGYSIHQQRAITACCLSLYKWQQGNDVHTPASQLQASNHFCLGWDGIANLLGQGKLLLGVGIHLPDNGYLESTMDA